MSKAQGAGSKDVVTVVKAAVPNGWPTIRTVEELDQAGKLAGKYRNQAGLSNGATTAFGSKSSTYRSKGSTGKGENDPTIRQITVKGKVIQWQVYPLQAAAENLTPYFMIVDLYQNYVRCGSSMSGIMIDATLITLSDPDMVHETLTKLAGVTETEFAAYVKVCEATRDYWQAVTGKDLPIGTTVFDITVGDGSVTPAAPKGEKTATNLAEFSWD